MTKDSYECPRCGYSTLHKTSMKRHLYSKQKMCPTITSMISLTDDIKEHIMNYKKYLVQSGGNMLQTINQYNTINNFIATINPIEKVSKLIEYKNLDIIDFEQTVEDKLSDRAKRLEKNLYKNGFTLKFDDILDIIDQVSKINDFVDFVSMNLIYDNLRDKLHIYQYGTWDEMILTLGIKRVIELIQLYYFDFYECYLIRRYNNKESDTHDLLEQYYKFIGIYDIEPYIKLKSDNKVLYPREDEHFHINYSSYDLNKYTLCDKFYNLYCKTRDKTTKSEINSVKKSVADIIIRNSNHNIRELNKKITEIFRLDSIFKADLINIS